MSTVIGLSVRFSGKATTDRIKARKTGDGQFGSARFATEKEKRETFSKVRFEPDAWRRGRNREGLPQGIVVGTEKTGGKLVEVRIEIRETQELAEEQT